MHKQYQSLQAGRAGASLLVVLHHASLAISTFKGLWEVAHPYQMLQGLAFGVEFFFVLSGIVILLAHRNDLGRQDRVWMYAWKRFRRIYPIYWFICACWLIVYLGFAAHADVETTKFLTLLSSFTLVHIGTFSSLNGVSWTLFHEVLFYIVFATAIVNRRFGTWLFGCWMVCSLAVPLLSSSPWSTTYFFSPLHLLFLYGMLVVAMLNKKSRIPPEVFALTGFITFCISVIMAAHWGYQTLWLQQLAGLAAAAMLHGTMQLEKAQKLSIPRILVYFGNASYSIYLAHMPVIYVLAKPLYRLSSSLHLGVPSCMMILFGLGTAVGCLCHSLVEVPMMRFLGAFGGSKRPLQTA